MKPAEAKRVLEIVDDAHGLSGDELQSYLDSVCGEDSLLRREVLDYLAYDVPGSVLPAGADNATAPEIPHASVSETRYNLGDEIARGGMGVVLQAFDNNIRRDVAVKVLRSEWESKPDIIRRFLQEAQIGGQLQHPGIAPVYEIGRLPDGRPFIAMKLVKGATLEDLLAQRRDADDDQARFLGIFEQVCQAIAFSHRRGVIHRDLKPSNVMVGEFGEVQVMDWGIAKLLSDEQPEASQGEESSHAQGADSDWVKVDTDGAGHSTRVGQLMGSPMYMAPEQSIGRADKTADVFSLGSILCEILTGEKTAGDLDTACEQLDRCPCDQELAELAKDCLQRNEADRPQNAGVVAARISAHLNAIQSRLKEAEIAAARVEVRAEEERWRRRRTLWTIAGAAMLLAVAAALIVSVRYSANQRSMREQTETTVSSLSTAHGILVPRVIQDLHKLPGEMVLPELRRQFNTDDETRRLRLAYGLASFGDVKVDLLVSQVATVSPDEIDNLVRVLDKSNGEAVSALEAAAQVAETHEDWRLKARLAMLALHLNVPGLATDMCQPRPDPIQRSLFIEECSTWHGDLNKLGLLAADLGDGSLRSALAMVVGSVPTAELAAGDRQAWQKVLSNWYQQQPDAGTHSAAGWALRQWNLALPTIIAAQQASEMRHWYINSVGMTMVEIPAGIFVLEDESCAEVVAREFTLANSFFLADREVTKAQFYQFIDDPQCPQEEKPTDFDGVSTDYSPSEQHPVHNVTWFAAIRFCNWLSRREGLASCYVPIGQKQGIGTGARTYYMWELAPGAGGYRLPTEAEWEYACRAAAETVFHFGNDNFLLDRYAVYRAGRPEPVATKMPNAWGLFDMHGNVWEWCHDWNTDFKGDPPNKLSRALTHYHRAQRGGAFVNPSTRVGSATRIRMHQDMVGYVTGFRVARNCP